MMVRVDMTRIHVLALVRLGLLAGFLAATGCSDPASVDKRDETATKEMTKKSMELYQAKTPAKKGYPAAAKSRP
jgi:hypothetical protein